MLFLTILQCHQLEIIPSITFEELIENTQNRKKADAGIMAIENSIVGSILPNYSLIRKSKLGITGEVYLRIKQNLLAKGDTQIADLKEVRSHPMAIAQCKSFFKKFPNIKLIETEDTALSAKHVSENNLKQCGVIASSQAAEIYNLNILAEGIETNKQNFTRFLVLEESTNGKPIENVNKFSICFSLKHEIGSLHKILAELASQNANLTKIQSVPIPGQNWHYLFFVDFVLNDLTHYQEILKELRLKTEAFQVLGCYQNGKYYDN